MGGIYLGSKLPMSGLLYVEWECAGTNWILLLHNMLL